MFAKLTHFGSKEVPCCNNAANRNHRLSKTCSLFSILLGFLQGHSAQLQAWVVLERCVTSTRVSPVAMNDTRMKHHSLAVNGIRKAKNDWLLDGFFIRIPATKPGFMRVIWFFTAELKFCVI